MSSVLLDNMTAMTAVVVMMLVGDDMVGIREEP